MARNKQPYLPLYVQDWLTNRKLRECSLEAQGLMINIMCIMHKEDDYGKITIRDKYKTSSKHLQNISLFLSKLLPFSETNILESLTELVEVEVLRATYNSLTCDRMVRDANTSKLRASAGSTGGKRTKAKSENKDASFATQFAADFATAKLVANAENENENENAIILVDTVLKKEKNKKRKKAFSELDSEETYPVEFLANVYSEDFKLLNSVSKTTGKTPDELKSCLVGFTENLSALGRNIEKPREFSKYFLNAMKLQTLPTWAKPQVKAASASELYTYVWNGIQPKQGTEAQYLNDKQNFGMFGFKTLKSPSSNV
jgi:hypothetical protein